MIHSPLLAHWASHAYYSLSFLSPCSHFHTGIGLLTFSHRDRGPFNVCMHCLVVSWALDLGACFSHHLFLSLHLCIFISSYWLCYSSLLPYPIYCLFVPYSLHPEWWASSVHHMEDSHIISIIYLTDTGLEILGLRRSSRQREFVCYLITWGCVHLLLISSLGFICSRSGYAYLYICKNKIK